MAYTSINAATHPVRRKPKPKPTPIADIVADVVAPVGAAVSVGADPEAAVGTTAGYTGQAVNVGVHQPSRVAPPRVAQLTPPTTPSDIASQSAALRAQLVAPVALGAGYAGILGARGVPVAETERQVAKMIEASDLPMPALPAVKAALGVGGPRATLTSVPPSQNTQRPEGSAARITSPTGGAPVTRPPGTREKPKIQGPLERRVAKALAQATRRSAPPVDALVQGFVDPVTGMKLSDSPYATSIARAAIKGQKKYGVPASVTLAVTGQESGYGTNRGPSTADAVGIGQGIPDTRNAQVAAGGPDFWAGDDPNNPTGRLTPAQAREQTLAASYLLGSSLDSGSTIEEALNSYTGGYGDVYNDPVSQRARAFKALDRTQVGTGTPIPDQVRQRALDVLGAKASRSVISGVRHPETAEAAGPHPHLVKGFLDAVTISEGLPTAEDLGIKNDGPILRNIHPELQRALIRLSEQTGIKPDVNEGFRTYSYQASLDATPGLYAAAAGQSNHESGLAVDIGNETSFTEEQLNAAGLWRAEGGVDPVHFELQNQPAALVGPKAGDPAVGGGSIPAGATSGPISAAVGGGVAAPGTPATSTSAAAARGTAMPQFGTLEPPVTASVPFAAQEFGAARDAISGGAGDATLDPAVAAEVEAILRQARLI